MKFGRKEGHGKLRNSHGKIMEILFAKSVGTMCLRLASTSLGMRTEDRGPVSPSVFVSCDNSLQEDFGLSNLKLSQEKIMIIIIITQ